MTLVPSSHHLLSSRGADSTETSHFRGLPRIYSAHCPRCENYKPHGEDEKRIVCFGCGRMVRKHY